MSLPKTEMELIAAPCPFHLATRTSTLSPWIAFHAVECQEAVTVGRWQTPIGASVREITALGRLPDRNLVLEANLRLCLFFFLTEVEQ